MRYIWLFFFYRLFEVAVSRNSPAKKKVEWKINFFFYWLFEVAVSRNSPAKKKVGVGNQLFLLLAFESGNFSKLPYTLSDWPVRGKPHVKCAACLGHTDSTYSTESTRFGKCPSAQSTSGFRGKPKVANSRKLGGKFSKVGWQILESCWKCWKLVEFKKWL